MIPMESFSLFLCMGEVWMLVGVLISSIISTLLSYTNIVFKFTFLKSLYRVYFPFQEYQAKEFLYNFSVKYFILVLKLTRLLFEVFLVFLVFLLFQAISFSALFEEN